MTRHIVRGGALALLLLSFGAANALATPASLRSESDVLDLADAFMRHIVTGDVTGAYALLTEHEATGAKRLSERIRDAGARRKQLRQTLGLSNGYEPVGIERAGERVVRRRREGQARRG